MPIRLTHQPVLLLLTLSPFALALPQRVQGSTPPPSLPASYKITVPNTSMSNDNFLATFFESPALTGITIALAASLFLASLVTIVCLVNARRKAGVHRPESNEGRGDVADGGSVLRDRMGEGGGILSGLDVGAARNDRKAGKGGERWRVWPWGKGARKAMGAGEKERGQERRKGKGRMESG